MIGDDGRQIKRADEEKRDAASALVERGESQLDADEQAYRQALCQHSAAIATAQALVEDFGRIVRGRAHAELDAWLAAAAGSRIAELVSFARGIRRDKDAVAAALRSPYSQDQVEGHVNRVKMLKRQTYGRANFELSTRYPFCESGV